MVIVQQENLPLKLNIFIESITESASQSSSTLVSAFGIQLEELSVIGAHCWGLFNQWSLYIEGHESSQEPYTRACAQPAGGEQAKAGGYIDLAPRRAAAAAVDAARTVKIQRYVAKEFNDPSILGHCVDYVKQLSGRSGRANVH